LKDQQKYYQLLPEKVVQDLPVIEDLMRAEIKGYSSGYLKEIISMICFHIRRKSREGIEVEDPPLRMEYVRMIVPNAEKYIRVLIEIGIIKRTSFYIPGEISYRYNFTTEYQSKYLAIKIDNARLIYRIKKTYESFNKLVLKSIRGQSNQFKFLKMITLAEGWRDYVESFKENQEQYNSILASALRIVRGEFYCKIDNTEGRFHSNLTNMKKGLRKYVRINGQPLTNIDLKNSQPYLSAILLTFPSKVSWLAKKQALSMLLERLKISLNEDVKKYIYLVTKGQFYEYLIQEFSKEGLILDRKEVKNQVLRILFAPNRLPKKELNRKCRLIFQDRFPTVHRIFSKIRGRDQSTSEFENSNRFAILLASIESHLLLNVIVRRINKEYPSIIALTIHDSIMTGFLTDDVATVKRIMIEELENFVGFQPQIEIESYKEIIEEEEKNNKLLIQYDVVNFVSAN
jgi:hypothetical protein